MCIYVSIYVLVFSYLFSPDFQNLHVNLNVPESVWGQVVSGFLKPGLVEDVSAVVGTIWSLMFIPIQSMLWFLINK